MKSPGDAKILYEKLEIYFMWLGRRNPGSWGREEFSNKRPKIKIRDIFQVINLQKATVDLLTWKKVYGY